MKFVRVVVCWLHTISFFRKWMQTNHNFIRNISWIDISGSWYDVQYFCVCVCKIVVCHHHCPLDLYVLFWTYVCVFICLLTFMWSWVVLTSLTTAKTYGCEVQILAVHVEKSSERWSTRIHVQDKNAVYKKQSGFCGILRSVSTTNYLQPLKKVRLLLFSQSKIKFNLSSMLCYSRYGGYIMIHMHLYNCNLYTFLGPFSDFRVKFKIWNNLQLGFYLKTVSEINVDLVWHFAGA